MKEESLDSDPEELPRGMQSDPTLQQYKTPFESVAALTRGEPMSADECPLEEVRICGSFNGIAHDAPMRPARKLNGAQLASLGVDTVLSQKGTPQI